MGKIKRQRDRRGSREGHHLLVDWQRLGASCLLKALCWPRGWECAWVKVCVCVCVPRWLKVMVCINREGICASVLSWIFFLRFIDFYLAASPRTRRQIACACVCLCLTCGTPAQTAVSMARAASCHRKAGLPELRAPLQLVCVHSGFLILDILQHHRRVKVHTFINKWRKWVSYSCSCISATFYFGTKLCPRSACLRKSNC